MWEMGRSLSIDGVGVTFGTGTTMAFFHWEGMAPDDREAFMMSVIGRLIEMIDLSAAFDTCSRTLAVSHPAQRGVLSLRNSTGCHFYVKRGNY